MADLGEIVVPVNFTEVLDGIKAAKSFERQIQVLSKAISSGAITTNQYRKAMLELKREYQALGVSSQKATAVVQGYAKSLVDSKKAQDDLTAAKQRAETAFALGAQKAKEEARAIEESAKAQIQAERAVVREREAWFAQQRRRLAMMRESERMAEIQAMATDRSTGAFGRFGFAAQQAGYQVGDFLVQIQSGTNPLVAFGQQATQLAGLLTLSLNPAIVAWGVGLSIIVPLVTAIGATFMRTKKDVEEYNKPLNEALEITKKLREETDAIRFPDATKKVIDDLQVRFEEARQKVVDLQNQIARGQIAAGQGGAGAIMFALAGNQAQEELDAATLVLESLKEEIRLRDLLVQRENARVADAKAYLAELQKQKEEQKKMNDKIEYGKDVFHALAGETSSVSFYMSEAFKSAVGLSNVNFDNIKTAAFYMSSLSQFGRGLPAAPGGPRKSYFAPTDFSNTNFGGSRADSRMAGAPPPVEPPTILSGSGGGEGGGGGQSPEQIIADMRKQLELQKALVGTSDEYQKIVQAVGIEYAKANPQIVKGLIDQMQALDELMEKEKKRQQLFNSVQSSLENGFMSMIDGTKSVKEAFRSMAYDIIKELYKVLVVQRMVGSFNNSTGQGSGLMGLISTGFSSVVGGASATPKASPPPMARMSAPNKGEAVTVNNVINVTGTGDAAYVRGEVAKMMPQITGATKAAVIEARKRGGQMAAAFK
jgi:hypothetical protein